MEEPLTKTSKFSTVSHPQNSLKCFPGAILNQRIYFTVLAVESDSEMKQKWGTTIELHIQRRTSRVL